MDNFEEDINWLILKLRLDLKSSKLKFELKKSELEFDLKIIVSYGIGIEVEKKMELECNFKKGNWSQPLIWHTYVRFNACKQGSNIHKAHLSRFKT